MTPDYERAAIKATETLIRYGIGTAPIDPLPILKRTPGVLVLSFEEMSSRTNVERETILSMVGCENQDAITTVFIEGGELHYIVAYNRMLSSRIVDRALARELGHIILGHDGSKPEDVRNEEAKCFAHHLLCPRALIHAINETGCRLTVDAVGNITGFYEYCLSCIRKQDSVHVPAEMNRAVKELFAPYIRNLKEYLRYSEQKDHSALADFGTYMEGYEE